MADDQLVITQIRSLSGTQLAQRRTVRALGLRKIRQTVTHPDRPEIRGMVAKVAHLVEVRYQGDDAPVELEAGQEPKGAGNPAAAPSVPDEEAAALAEAIEEGLAPEGQVDNIGDLVQNPPTLATTDTPNKPKVRGSGDDADDADDVESADADTDVESADVDADAPTASDASGSATDESTA